ncbi:MAG: XkdX family protein [Sarcina sp.]
MDFNTWKEFYGWGFASKNQLQQAVTQGMLTQEQYNEIVSPVSIKPVIPTVPVKEQPNEPVVTPTPIEKPKVESVTPAQTTPVENAKEPVTTTIAPVEDTTLENIIG